MNTKLCMCGSGLEKRPRYDARQIFLAYVCDDCEERVLGSYRPDVLTDPNYWADEEIDGDGDFV